MFILNICGEVQVVKSMAEKGMKRRFARICLPCREDWFWFDVTNRPDIVEGRQVYIESMEFRYVPALRSRVHDVQSFEFVDQECDRPATGPAA